MNYIETKLFGTVAQPSNLIELLTLVSNHAGERRNVYLWRGQANITWPIHSSAFRRLANRGNVRESDMQSYENIYLGMQHIKGIALKMEGNFQTLNC